MWSPSGRAVAITSTNMKAIWNQPLRVIGVCPRKACGRAPDDRSELLGVEQCVDEVDGETAGHDGAEDEVEHGAPHALSAQRA
jgi:hypothetical protein